MIVHTHHHYVKQHHVYTLAQFLLSHTSPSATDSYMHSSPTSNSTPSNVPSKLCASASAHKFSFKKCVCTVFHAWRSKYRRVLANRCTQEILCAHTDLKKLEGTLYTSHST